MEPTNVVDNADRGMSLGENVSEAPKKPKTQLFVLVGIAVVLVLTVATIVVVLKYSARNNYKSDTAVPGAPSETASPSASSVEDAQTKKLEVQGASTKVSDIQKDLDDTSLDNIDKDLDGLEDLIQ